MTISRMLLGRVAKLRTEHVENRNPWLSRPGDEAIPEYRQVEGMKKCKGFGLGRRWKRVWQHGLALLCLAYTITAGAQNLEATVTPSKTIAVGDAVTITFPLRLESGDTASIKRQQSFDGAQALSVNSKKDSITIRLLALEPKKTTIGPIAIQILRRDGTIETLQTKPFSLEIQSLIKSEPNATPKPPSSPVSVFEPNTTLLIALGVIALLALAAAFAPALIRKWKSDKHETPPITPSRPAWEEALAKLAELKEELHELEDGALLINWIDRLSDISRDYLGQRYGFEALESTTEEALSHLRSHPPDALNLDIVEQILRQSDLAKFAKAPPLQDQCLALQKEAVHLVLITTPKTVAGTGE